jgi:hypothetical protein
MSDPLSAAGLAIGVASLTAQALVGCMQGTSPSFGVIRTTTDQMAAIDLILKAKNLKPEFQYMSILLQLERQRLWNWSDVSGLTAYLDGDARALDSSLTGLNRHMILDVVLQVQKLCVSFIKVRGRYEEIVAEDLERRDTVKPLVKSKTVVKVNLAAPEADGGTESDLVKRFPKSAEKVKALLRAFESTQQLPQRLRWAFWDVDKFRGLLDRLKELNDCLISLVDNSVKMQILSVTKETNINFLGLCNKLDDLGQLVSALVKNQEHQRAAARDPVQQAILGSSYAQPQDHSSYMQLEEAANKEILELSLFKKLVQSYEDDAAKCDAVEDDQSADDATLGDRSMDRFKLDRNSVYILTSKSTTTSSTEGLRVEALYGGQRVWIEYKSYQPHSIHSTEPDSRILTRVQQLTALLGHDPKPAAFRVPHCLGYFDDLDHEQEHEEQWPPGRGGAEISRTFSDAGDQDFRFGFVFTKPTGVNPTTVPVALSELFQRPRKPSLTDRVTLAKAIANCLYYLHSVNWLHKGLRSQNIVFFPNEFGDVDYGAPYLSGFDYARPGRDVTIDQPVENPDFDVYRHPDVQPSAPRVGKFKKSYDVYALGVVLVEIASWTPIADILEPEKNGAVNVGRVRERLLTESAFLDTVGFSVGSLFETGVKCCLGGATALGLRHNEEEEENEGARLIRGFHEQVVKRLEHIRC